MRFMKMTNKVIVSIIGILVAPTIVGLLVYDLTEGDKTILDELDRIGNFSIPAWCFCPMFLLLLFFLIGGFVLVQGDYFSKISKRLRAYEKVRTWRVKADETEMVCKIGIANSDGSHSLNLALDKGHGIYGPYVTLSGGLYLVSFYMKINDNTGTVSLGRLDVVSPKDGKLGEFTHELKDLHSSEFRRNHEYQRFVIAFMVYDHTEKVEFRYNTTPDIVNKMITFDRVTLRKLGR